MTWRNICVSTVVLALAACRPPAEDAPSKPVGPMLVGPENLATVRRAVVESGPRISGSLEARRQSVIRAEVGGSVLKLTAELGQAVKAGQLLVRIEAKGLQDAVDGARSGVTSAEQELALAQRELERTTRLVQAGGLSPREQEAAQNAVVAADARVKDARARLSSTQQQFASVTVQSPIAGVVSQRPVHEGDVVAPGSPLYTIIDPSSMRLEAAVTSEDLPALKVGTPVHFTVRGYTGQSFEGKVERIAPAADPVTRQIPILVDIPNPGGRLIAGLFAEGRVTTDRHEGLVVPETAVDESGPSPTVTRVRDGKAEQVAVKLGVRDPRGERIEIGAGLAEGDLVLVGAARNLAAGTPVEITREPAGADASVTP
jgi:RND family efflux transporter MFP subunit